MTWRDEGLHLTRGIFLRFLAAIYLVAFISLWVQLEGLFGDQGILPAREFLDGSHEQLGTAAYWRVPTLAWFHPTMGFLHTLCGAGVVLSLVALVGPIAPAFFLLWASYLSLV